MGHHARQPRRDLAHRLAKTPTSLEVTFVETNRLDEWLSHSSDHTLAVISFGTSLPSPSRPVNCPILSINLPQLTEPTRVEVWTSDQPIRMVRHNQTRVAMNDDIAAVFISMEESTGLKLETTTYQTYCRLLSTLRELGYPYLWRAWNYFPAINDHEQGLERYQSFCTGRHQAFVEQLPDFPASLPAGTAVGTTSGPLQVYAVAGSSPAHHLGNPRQVHAYEYPRTYGPRSPSFSRATIAQMHGTTQLFLAGTASVVGHASRHVGSAHAQTQETLENIGTVLRHAQDTHSAGSFVDAHRAIYKVYIRHRGDEEKIRQVIENSPLSLTQPLFLQGELCRRELLVEIEAVISSD